LTDDDIVFEGSAGEAMELHAIDFDNRRSFPKSLLHVPVLKDSIPDLVRAGIFVQDARVGESLLSIDHRIEGFVVNLDNLSAVIGNCRGHSYDGDHGFSLIADFRHSEGIVANLAACIGGDLD